jgi:hypothetical protein
VKPYLGGGGTSVYQKVSGLSHNEINNNDKHSLRSYTKGYGGKTHYTDSQNRNATAPSGRELYNFQFSFQAASPETFGYTLAWFHVLLTSALDGGEWWASRTGRFTPRERAAGIHWIGGWVGSRAGMDTMTKRKKSHHCPRRELNPSRPARSLVTILTELPQFSLSTP